MPLKTKYEQTKTYDAPLNADLTSVQDVFPIEAIDESGIFKLSGKMYSKTYVLSDINFAGLSDEEQKSIIISFSKILKTLPCRFSYSIANEYDEDFCKNILYKNAGDDDDKLRLSYNKVITEKITDAKQGLYQRIYLTLTLCSDSVKEAKSSFFSIEGAVRNALSAVGAQGPVMKTLSIDERMDLLYNFTHTGIMKGMKFSFKESAESGLDFVNKISPAYLSFENDSFEINGCFGKVLYIDSYPKTLESDIIAKLSDLRCISFVTVNNELLDTSSYKQEIMRKYASIGMKIEGEKKRNRSNNDFLADASKKLLDEKEKIELLISDIDSLDDHYFNTTILVLLLSGSKEDLERNERKLVNAASLKGLTLKSCFSKQKEALVSALFLGSQEFKHVVNLSSSCLAMFMPFKTQEINDDSGLFYGINQISQNAIIADKKRLKNHNGLISGQSGSGKSMCSKSEIISTYLNCPEDQIFAIDPQSEYGTLINKLNGVTICFDPKKEVYLNPLDVSFDGIEVSDLRQIVSDKADFILTLLSSLLKRELDTEEQGIIDKVVDRVYSENFSLRKHISGEDDKETSYEIPEFYRSYKSSMRLYENMSPEEEARMYSPVMQDIYQGLMDAGTDKATRLALSMEVFVNGSLNLFNHRTNVSLSGRLIAFDIAGLKDNLRVPSMLIMMETLREKIKENSKKGIWTHIYIDEFHELLGIPQTAAFILKLWKEVRKMSGILTGITQNMSDLLNDDNEGKLSAILSNSEFFALLSQSTLDKKKLMDLLPDISPALFNFVDNAESGTGLLKFGNVTVPFDMRISKDSEIYRLINTDGGGYGV